MRPGRAADHSPPSSAAVMEEYSYTSTNPLSHTGPVTGSLYLTLCDATSCSKTPKFKIQLTWRQHAPTETAQRKAPEHSDLHVLATTARNTNRDTEPPNRDLNPETPKYETLVLPILLPRSVGGEEKRRALVWCCSNTSIRPREWTMITTKTLL